jgi:excisionase family DNA binding protein
MEVRTGSGEDVVESGVVEYEFLKPDEVSRLLRCGRTKTYELLQTGEIPSYRVGRNRIVRRGDVLAWLGEHQDGLDRPWSETFR